MRVTRQVILVVIILILSGLGITYTIQRSSQAEHVPATPAPLPKSVNSRQDQFRWSYSDGKRPVVDIAARHVQAVEDGARSELQDVELHLYHKDGKAYDRVKSAHASFDPAQGVLFSDGAVEITMGLSSEGETKNGRLVTIRSSGVRFESKTGKAQTDREAQFTFDRGEGQCRGAEYNPVSRELMMFHDVKLKWRARKPEDPAMDIEGGGLIYNEPASTVLLSPWAKFRRGTLAMEAGNSLVTLKDGAITLVEAVKATGRDDQPGRKIEYSAGALHLRFAEDNAMQSITGFDNARLKSTSASGETLVTTARLDLEFEPQGGESRLRKSLATGKSVLESKPLIKPNTPAPETRIMRSDIIALYMRAGGEEIEKVETESPGQIEFLPNRPAQRRRTMNGDRLTILYGAANQIRSFRATKASTRSEPPQRTPKEPPALTWSDELTAEFSEKTGEMTKLEQTTNFRYEEGDQRATSDKAVLESARSLITLTGSARAWDPSGSTSADLITLDQKTSDFTANGNVNSTRMPDKKKTKGPDTLLGGDEPVQARAASMTSSDGQQKIRYEGKALLWQGANRLEGERVDIDRSLGRLQAQGDVVSQFVDKPKPAVKGKAATRPEVTIIKAPAMEYLDKERLAHYRGGVRLTRPGTTVRSAELRAWLAPEGSDASLEKAFADGQVEIVQTTPGRTRTGTAEHAEYYLKEERVLLEGGEPQLVDTVKGNTRGTRLTYFGANDKLLVEGAEDKPVRSRIPRR